jgi:lysophospholipase L1-like esterase
MCHIPSRRLSATALGCLLTSVFIVGVAAYPFLPPERTPSGAATADRQQSATTPTSRENEPWWRERHEDALERAKEGKIDLLFIGDSITQGWETEGEGVWQERYAPRHAVNLGFSGDRTQHVLWRLQNGEIDVPEGCVPRLAIVMIGTNNSNGDDYTAEQIAAGITKIVKTLRDKLPKTKVLLLAIFPRGEQMNPQRDKNAIASDKASKVADGKMVHYLDIGRKFMNEDKAISREIMPDALHLSARGYQIWSEAMEEKVKELMGDAAPAKSD